MPLFGPPSVKKLQARGDVKRLLKALRYTKDPAIPLAAMRALIELDHGSHAVDVLVQIGGEQAVSLLIAALKAPSLPTRRAAAAALERVGWQPPRDKTGALYWIVTQRWEQAAEIGSPAVEPLIDAVQGRDAEARWGAAQALGQIGAPAAAAAGPLLAALLSRDARLRRAAEAALLHIGSPAVDALIAALRDGQGSVRVEAASLLARIEGAAPRAVAPLIAALGQEETALRQAAATALGVLGDPRAVVPLVAALGGNPADVRRDAAGALGALGRRGGAARALDSLVAAALSDADHKVRQLAARAVVGIGGTRAINLLVPALGDPKSGSRAAGMLDGLGWQPPTDETGVRYCIASRRWDECVALGALAVEPLIAVLQGPAAQNTRCSAATTLGRIGDPRAIAPLIATLQNRRQGEAVRRAAATALGHIGGEQALAPLIDALHDSTPGVCTAAAGALEQMGDERAIGPLITYWIATDRCEKCVALGALAVEPLLAALQEASWIGRRTILRAMGQIGDGRAVQPLLDVLRDGDKDLRRVAATSLVSLYHSGTLDKAQMSAILTHRSTITYTRHTDRQGREYYVCGDPSTHHAHTDYTDGVGVDFAL